MYVQVHDLQTLQIFRGLHRFDELFVASITSKYDNMATSSNANIISFRAFGDENHFRYPPSIINPALSNQLLTVDCFA